MWCQTGKLSRYDLWKDPLESFELPKVTWIIRNPRSIHKLYLLKSKKGTYIPYIPYIYIYVYVSNHPSIHPTNHPSVHPSQPPACRAGLRSGSLRRCSADSSDWARAPCSPAQSQSLGTWWPWGPKGREGAAGVAESGWMRWDVGYILKISDEMWVTYTQDKIYRWNMKKELHTSRSSRDLHEEMQKNHARILTKDSDSGKWCRIWDPQIRIICLRP